MLLDKEDRKAQLQAVELDTLCTGCVHDSGHDRWLLEMVMRERPRNDSQGGKCDLLPSTLPSLSVSSKYWELTNMTKERIPVL